MWRIIDKEMTLKDCSIYCYSPEENPYDDEEEPTLWSFNYFFFNKARKRVCYIYLRGLSIMNNNNNSSDSSAPRTPISGAYGYYADGDSDETPTSEDTGASKRASFWLGNRAAIRNGGWNEDEMDDDDDDDDAEEPRLLSPAEHAKQRSMLSPSDEGEAGSPFSDRSTSQSQSQSQRQSLSQSQSQNHSQSQRSLRSRSKSTVRGMSEDLMESMEV
jgi:hypothetical protein